MLLLKALQFLNPCHILRNTIGQFKNMGLTCQAVPKILQHALPFALVQFDLQNGEHPLLSIELLNKPADRFVNGNLVLRIKL